MNINTTQNMQTIPQSIKDTLPQSIGKLKFPKTNIIVTASAIALSACANTGATVSPFDDREIMAMRQVANDDINSAIAHKIQQENLLREVREADGGVHNRQLPPTHKVDAHLDIQAISHESMQSIVNDGQDSRHSVPMLPASTTPTTNYAKSTAEPTYTPPMGVVTTPIQSIDGSDVYNNQSQTQNITQVQNLNTRTPVNLNWGRGGNAIPVPAPTHLSTHVKSSSDVPQSAPTAFNNVATKATAVPKIVGSNTTTRTPVVLGKTNVATAETTPKATININNNMRPLMQELPTPINGRVKVSEALNMVAKASGYSFSIQGNDKDYIVDFKNFSGSLLDLLKVVGDGLGDKGTVSVETKTKSIKLKYD